MTLPSDEACASATGAASSLRAEARAWLERRPDVEQDWFRFFSSLHGVTHTQRVHIHAQRLLEQLRWNEADRRLVLCAALCHDIGRFGDGVEPGHGATSVERADEMDRLAGLVTEDAAVVRFAIVRHSLPDSGASRLATELAAGDDPARRLAEPERALRVLWLLKDADALDRVRLGFGERADPRQLRHKATVQLIPFADALYAELG
jgi:HD superfamily phosphodiesterase